MPAKCLHLVEWFASAAKVECGDVQETLPSLIYSGPLKWEGYECVSIPYTERISITYVMASNVRAHSLLSTCRETDFGGGHCGGNGRHWPT